MKAQERCIFTTTRRERSISGVSPEQHVMSALKNASTGASSSNSVNPSHAFCASQALLQTPRYSSSASAPNPGGRSPQLRNSFKISEAASGSLHARNACSHRDWKRSSCTFRPGAQLGVNLMPSFAVSKSTGESSSISSNSSSGDLAADCILCIANVRLPSASSVSSDTPSLCKVVNHDAHSLPLPLAAWISAKAACIFTLSSASSQPNSLGSLLRASSQKAILSVGGTWGRTRSNVDALIGGSFSSSSSSSSLSS
mmetsp:Transcript_131598/g.239292  ORF Transcript_131598/g.239292 Transcript_131598/m.239292 type:complete len:256 (-) Transcript_131598:459-1226(-)